MASLDRFSVYSGFGLDRFHCICEMYLSIHFYNMSLSFSIDVRFHYLLTLFLILYNKDISVFSIDVRFHYLLTLFLILYNKDISVFSMTINVSYVICVCLCVVVSNTY